MFDKYCHKAFKYRLLLSKFLPRLLLIFGLIPIKFKAFFYGYVELYLIVFKLKVGGGARVKKKLVTTVRGYRPFSYKWLAFAGKNTPFFNQLEFFFEEDEEEFFSKEFTDVKNYYFWQNYLIKTSKFRKAALNFFLLSKTFLKTASLAPGIEFDYFSNTLLGDDNISSSKRAFADLASRANNRRDALFFLNEASSKSSFGLDASRRRQQIFGRAPFFLLAPTAGIFLFWSKLTNFFKKAFFLSACFGYYQRAALISRESLQVSYPKIKHTSFFSQQATTSKFFFAAPAEQSSTTWTKLCYSSKRKRRKRKIRRLIGKKLFKRLAFFKKNRGLIFSLGEKKTLVRFFKLNEFIRLTKLKRLLDFFASKTLLRAKFKNSDFLFASLFLSRARFRGYRGSGGWSKKKPQQRPRFLQNFAFCSEIMGRAISGKHRTRPSSRRGFILKNAKILKGLNKNFLRILQLKKNLVQQRSRQKVSEILPSMSLLVKAADRSRKKRRLFIGAGGKQRLHPRRVLSQQAFFNRSSAIFSKNHKLFFMFFRKFFGKKKAKKSLRKKKPWNSLFFIKKSELKKKQKLLCSSGVAGVGVVARKAERFFKHRAGTIRGIEAGVSRALQTNFLYPQSAVTTNKQFTVPNSASEERAMGSAGQDQNKEFFFRKLRYLQYFYFFDVSLREFAVRHELKKQNMANATFALSNSVSLYQQYTAQEFGDSPSAGCAGINASLSSILLNSGHPAFISFYANLLFAAGQRDNNWSFNESNHSLKRKIGKRHSLVTPTTSELYRSGFSYFVRLKRAKFLKKKRFFLTSFAMLREKHKNFLRSGYSTKNFQKSSSKRPRNNLLLEAAAKPINRGKRHLTSGSKLTSTTAEQPSAFFYKKNLLSGKKLFSPGRVNGFSDFKPVYSQKIAFWYKNVFLKKFAQFYYFLGKRSSLPHASSASTLRLRSPLNTKNLASKRSRGGGGVSAAKLFWYNYLSEQTFKKIKQQQAAVFYPRTVKKRNLYKTIQNRRIRIYAFFLFRKFSWLKQKMAQTLEESKDFQRKRRVIQGQKRKRGGGAKHFSGSTKSASRRSFIATKTQRSKLRTPVAGGSQKNRNSFLSGRRVQTAHRGFFFYGWNTTTAGRRRREITHSLDKALLRKKIKFKKKRIQHFFLLLEKKKKTFFSKKSKFLKNKKLVKFKKYVVPFFSTPRHSNNIARRRRFSAPGFKFLLSSLRRRFAKNFGFASQKSFSFILEKFKNKANPLFQKNKNTLHALRGRRHVYAAYRKLNSRLFFREHLFKKKTFFFFKKNRKSRAATKREKRFRANNKKKTGLRALSGVVVASSQFNHDSAKKQKFKSKVGSGVTKHKPAAAKLLAGVTVEAPAPRITSNRDSRQKKKNNHPLWASAGSSGDGSASFRPLATGRRRAKTKEEILLEIESWSKAGGSAMVVKKQDPDFYKSLHQGEDSVVNEKFLRRIAPMLAAQGPSASNYALPKNLKNSAKGTVDLDKQQQAALLAANAARGAGDRAKLKKPRDRQNHFFRQQLATRAKVNKHAETFPYYGSQTLLNKFQNSNFMRNLRESVEMRWKASRKRFRGKKNWHRRRARRYLHILRTRKHKNVYSQMLMLPLGYFRPEFIAKKPATSWTKKAKTSATTNKLLVRKSPIFFYSELRKKFLIPKRKLHGRRRKNFVLRGLERAFFYKDSQTKKFVRSFSQKKAGLPRHLRVTGRLRKKVFIGAPSKLKVFFLQKSIKKLQRKRFFRTLAAIAAVNRAKFRFNNFLFQRKPKLIGGSGIGNTAANNIAFKKIYKKKRFFLLAKNIFRNRVFKKKVKAVTLILRRKLLFRKVRLKNSIFLKRACFVRKKARKKITFYFKRNPFNDFTGSAQQVIFAQRRRFLAQHGHRLFLKRIARFLNVAHARTSENRVPAVLQKKVGHEQNGKLMFLQAKKQLAANFFFRKTKQIFFFYRRLLVFKNKKAFLRRGVLSLRQRKKKQLGKKISWLLEKKSDTFFNKLPRSINLFLHKKKAAKKLNYAKVFFSTAVKLQNKRQKARDARVRFTESRRAALHSLIRHQRNKQNKHSFGREQKKKTNVTNSRVFSPAITNKIGSIKRRKAAANVSGSVVGLRNITKTGPKFRPLGNAHAPIAAERAVKKKFNVSAKAKQDIAFTKKIKNSSAALSRGGAPAMYNLHKKNSFIQLAGYNKKSQRLLAVAKVGGSHFARPNADSLWKDKFYNSRKIHFRGLKILNKLRFSLRSLWYRSNDFLSVAGNAQYYSDNFAANFNLFKNIPESAATSLLFLLREGQRLRQMQIAKKRRRPVFKFNTKLFLKTRKSNNEAGRSSFFKVATDYNFVTQKTGSVVNLTNNKKVSPLSRNCFFVKNWHKKFLFKAVARRRLLTNNFAPGANVSVLPFKYFKYAEKHKRTALYNKFISQQEAAERVHFVYKKKAFLNFFAALASKKLNNRPTARRPVNSRVHARLLTNLLALSKKKTRATAPTIFSFKAKNSFNTVFDYRLPRTRASSNVATGQLDFHKPALSFLRQTAQRKKRRFFLFYRKAKSQTNFLLRVFLLFFFFSLLGFQKNFANSTNYLFKQRNFEIESSSYRLDQYLTNVSDVVLFSDYTTALTFFQKPSVFSSNGSSKKFCDASALKQTPGYFVAARPFSLAPANYFLKNSIAGNGQQLTRFFSELQLLNAFFISPAARVTQKSCFINSTIGTANKKEILGCTKKIFPLGYLVSTKNIFRAKIFNFSYPAGKRSVGRLTSKRWRFIRRFYLNWLKHPSGVIKKKTIKLLASKIYWPMSAKLIKLHKYFLRLFATRIHYIKKSFEFMFSEMLFGLFLLKAKVFFTNVLQVLTFTGISQRRTLFQKFLLTTYSAKRLNLRLKIFYFNFFNLYFYSVYFKNLLLFLNFLNKHFKTINDQRKMVKLSRNLISRCALLKINKNLIGLKFLISGKLNKRPRSRNTILMYRRASGTQAVDTKIYYASKQLFNKFGAFGAKLWLYSF